MIPVILVVIAVIQYLLPECVTVCVMSTHGDYHILDEIGQCLLGKD